MSNRFLKTLVFIVGSFIILGLVFSIISKYNSTTDSSTNIVGFWNLVELSNEGARGQIPKDLKTATIIFEDTGRVSGVAFCNQYSGNYTLEGSSIKFSELATTKKACGKTLMDHESKYFSNLENVTNYDVDGDRLYLNDESGVALLQYKLRPDPLVEDTDWNIIGYNNGKQAVTSVIIGTKITALFEEGTLRGTSGCNSYNSPYSIRDDNSIDIGIPAVTLVGCEENIMEQEQQYLQALQNSTRIQMTFDGLELRDDNGSLQVTMSTN